MRRGHIPLLPSTRPSILHITRVQTKGTPQRLLHDLSLCKSQRILRGQPMPPRKLRSVPTVAERRGTRHTNNIIQRLSHPPRPGLPPRRRMALCTVPLDPPTQRTTTLRHQVNTSSRHRPILLPTSTASHSATCSASLSKTTNANGSSTSKTTSVSTSATRTAQREGPLSKCHTPKDTYTRGWTPYPHFRCPTSPVVRSTTRHHSQPPPVFHSKGRRYESYG
jgi:hypothetical protein